MPDNSGGGAGPELVSMAQAFTGLPMEALIGAPLMAAAKANHQMACDQVNYLLGTCFKTAGDDKDAGYAPIMISMKVTRPVLTPSATSPDVKNIDSVIQLPMLTIMPLNSLAVDSVDVKFHMEVKSSFSEDQENKSESKNHEEGAFSGTGWIGPFRCTISGSVSHDSSSSSSDATHYAKSNLASYDVEVHAGQIPTPPGIGVLIQAFANAISPIQMPAQASSH
ncbi:MAG: DUF2589 domain-containing protein [Sphingomonadales bacterium]|nr:DUF2589 domain-containing protein [Sphingomonadales bacterium]